MSARTALTEHSTPQVRSRGLTEYVLFKSSYVVPIYIEQLP